MLQRLLAYCKPRPPAATVVPQVAAPVPAVTQFVIPAPPGETAAYTPPAPRRASSTGGVTLKSEATPVAALTPPYTKVEGVLCLTHTSNPQALSFIKQRLGCYGKRLNSVGSFVQYVLSTDPEAGDPEFIWNKILTAPGLAPVDWPHITHIDLEANLGDEGRSSSASLLHALCEIAKHFPNLKYITLYSGAGMREGLQKLLAEAPLPLVFRQKIYYFEKREMSPTPVYPSSEDTATDRHPLTTQPQPRRYAISPTLEAGSPPHAPTTPPENTEASPHSPFVWKNAAQVRPAPEVTVTAADPTT